MQIRFLVAAIAMLALGLPPVSATAAQISWGPYAVQSHVAQHNNFYGRRTVVDILRSGRTVRTILGNGSARTMVLRAGRHPLLIVSVGDLGNDGLDLVYGFQYSRAGVRNVFAVPGVLSGFRILRANMRGRPLLDVNDYASFVIFDHFSRSAIGPVERVYLWRGNRYVDATARFPRWTLRRAESAKQRFLDNRSAIERYVHSGYLDTDADSLGRSREDVMAPLVEYWANETAAGHPRTVDRFLHTHASPALRRWIVQHRPEFEAAMKLRSTILPADNRKILGYS